MRLGTTAQLHADLEEAEKEIETLQARLQRVTAANIANMDAAAEIAEWRERAEKAEADCAAAREEGRQAGLREALDLANDWHCGQNFKDDLQERITITDAATQQNPLPGGEGGEGEG